LHTKLIKTCFQVAEIPGHFTEPDKYTWFPFHASEAFIFGSKLHVKTFRDKVHVVHQPEKRPHPLESSFVSSVIFITFFRQVHDHLEFFVAKTKLFLTSTRNEWPSHIFDPVLAAAI
jgi:hypothetical protein